MATNIVFINRSLCIQEISFSQDNSSKKSKVTGQSVHQKKSFANKSGRVVSKSKWTLKSSSAEGTRHVSIVSRDSEPWSVIYQMTYAG